MISLSNLNKLGDGEPKPEIDSQFLNDDSENDSFLQVPNQSVNFTREEAENLQIKENKQQTLFESIFGIEFKPCGVKKLIHSDGQSEQIINDLESKSLYGLYL